MIAEVQDCITKEDCVKRGLVRLEKFYYKRSMLEKYQEDGWLDFGCKKFSSTDRLSAGQRLARDYYLGQFSSSKANDVRKVHVDGGSRGSIIDSALDARQRYFNAMRAVPNEFWWAVRIVCIEDKKLAANDNSDKPLARKQKLYAAKQDLCRGLDRLIRYYLRKK